MYGVVGRAFCGVIFERNHLRHPPVRPHTRFESWATTDDQRRYGLRQRQHGLGGPADMVGPVIGRVSYRQGSNGRLNLVLHTDFAQPNTTYQIFLVCGPAHALACGFITVGTLTTNATGVGNAGIIVSLATLQAPPFGCGYRTDHVDSIGGGISSVLTAGAINYFVSCAPGMSPSVPTGHGDPTG